MNVAIKWCKGHKYYAIGLQFNLFNQYPDLIIGWGSGYNKLGGKKVLPINNKEELVKVIDDIRKRRKYRKYQLIQDNLII